MRYLTYGPASRFDLDALLARRAVSPRRHARAGRHWTRFRRPAALGCRLGQEQEERQEEAQEEEHTAALHAELHRAHLRQRWLRRLVWRVRTHSSLPRRHLLCAGVAGRHLRRSLRDADQHLWATHRLFHLRGGPAVPEEWQLRHRLRSQWGLLQCLRLQQSERRRRAALHWG